MAKDPKYKTVAKAVRLERDEVKDDFFIVFKIVDEQFKQKIREDWHDDTELQLDGKNLVIKEE